MKEDVKAKHMKVQVVGCDHVGLFARNVMEQLAVWPGPTIFFPHDLTSLYYEVRREII